ncbi:MAG: class I SAM-dependent methyltransferase [bacterium]|jgi:SAM-dependent methyltransferase
MGWYEKRIFNPLIERGLKGEAMDAERGRLLKNARGRLLEIGPGTGLNFPHFPSDITRITSVSPEDELSPLARERARQRGATLRHVTSATPPWPFADGLFDTVVATLVLCSVKDVNRTLEEARRVLAPGGKLLIFEHVLGDSILHRACQHLWTPFLRQLACGCHANRQTQERIEAAGFAWDSLETRRTVAMPWIVSSVIFGIAQKTEMPC